MAIHCKKQHYRGKKSRDEGARRPKFSHFDKSRQLQVTISGNKRDNDAQANLAEIANDTGDERRSVQWYICHQRGDHDSTECPNGNMMIKMNNGSYKNFMENNAKRNQANPKKKYRVA